MFGYVGRAALEQAIVTHVLSPENSMFTVEALRDMILVHCTERDMDLMHRGLQYRDLPDDQVLRVLTFFAELHLMALDKKAKMLLPTYMGK